MEGVLHTVGLMCPRAKDQQRATEPWTDEEYINCIIHYYICDVECKYAVGVLFGVSTVIKYVS